MLLYAVESSDNVPLPSHMMWHQFKAPPMSGDAYPNQAPMRNIASTSQVPRSNDVFTYQEPKQRNVFPNQVPMQVNDVSYQAPMHISVQFNGPQIQGGYKNTSDSESNTNNPEHTGNDIVGMALQTLIH